MQQKYQYLNDLFNTKSFILYTFAMSKGKKHLKTVRLQIFNESTCNENTQIG